MTLNRGQLGIRQLNRLLLADIVGIFTPEEAEIFRQDKNMIIRMVGLNFDSGKAELKRNHLILVAKCGIYLSRAAMRWITSKEGA